jgi:hypothetical protein
MDPRVVAGEQDVRHRPAVEVCRARVMRVLEPAPELVGEALDLAGSLGERPGEAARHSVEEHHRRQVAVREDVRPDRDRVGREMLDDPLVEAFEARRQQRERVHGRELLDDLLRERPPLRRERDDARRTIGAVHGVKRSRDDVDAQHHAGAAAVRLVVDLARAERRRVAVVEEP